MAVAFVTNTSALGSAQNPTFSITVSGTNPVLTVKVGMDHTTADITSVSWSLGSGTAVEVKKTRNSTAFASVWAIPAPTGGAGTVTVNKDTGSINHQIDVSCFSGADQTTPCPSGDAVSSVASETTTLLTPSNLTANDATDAMFVNTITGNPTSVTPNQRYLNNTTSVNLETGDNTGTSGVTGNWDVTDTHASVAVRIQAPTGVQNALAWIKA